MSGKLARWNRLASTDAAKEILACCGSAAWAEGMARRRPVPDEATLLAAADETWRSLAKEDWMEAFRSHPRIGGAKTGESWDSRPAPARSSSWSKQEQENVAAAGSAIKADLAQANKEYEQRFARIFIVCATGKSAAEILKTLRRRMGNDDDTELREAAEQQRLITHLRLKKWLSE
jgi:2-oxo-4-hydroxy-4-carboxy-5-ureidoimidazoline decarboxylase